MRIIVSKSFFALALLVISGHCFSQNRTLYTWKMFLPYHSAIGICDAGDKLYCSGIYSIFSYEKSTGVIQTYDKASGLSDIGIQTMNYDPNTQYLAIAYTDNNLDFIYNGTDVYNIPDMESATATGSVSINNISFYNGTAYISSSLGISVVNLANMEIDDTYIIGANGQQLPVYASCIDGTNIYAATDSGIKYAPLSSTNLEDFKAWQFFNESENIPLSEASNMVFCNNHVFAVITGPGSTPDTLYRYNLSNNNWQKIYFDTTNNDDSIVSLAADNGTLYFSTWNQATQTGGKNVAYNSAGGLTVYSNLGHSRPVGWFESVVNNNTTSFEADFYGGLYVNPHPENTDSLENIVPDGPFANSVYRLQSKNGVLNVAAGGVNDSWEYEWNPDGFYIYKNDNWKSCNQYTNSFLDTFTDILCTAVVSSRNKTYFGSFLSGLIEYDNSTGDMTWYDQYNSILEGAIGDNTRTKISCLTTDNYDNLWIGNAGGPSLIKVIKNDGTWQKFTLPFTISLLKNMIVDQQNQIWALTRQQTGLVVFSYGGDLNNPVDNSVFLQSGTGQGNLPNSTGYCLADDLDGNIWVGTDQGIGVFYCAPEVFYGGCDAQQIEVVGTGGYIGYLFGMQSVRAIAVDAANRKWIGTTEGLWLISADGQTQLLNFNSSNSPMPADQVTDISIDNQTGEVFIGTIGGLVSFQGDAIDTCVDCKEALVYPNPVMPGYTGPIAIKGLASNAHVKITDISGTLIFQGQANGTQMIWNGMGYNGYRAKSGVYLVFSSDNSGQDRRVAKILITN